MMYYKALVLVVVVVLTSSPECTASAIEQEEPKDTFHEDWAPCLQKCAGVQGDGWVCLDNGGGSLAVLGRCLSECREFKAHENQTQCFCDYCKQGFVYANFFCTEPGAGPIRGTEECDSVVCSGEGNFHVGALACQERVQEQRTVRFQTQVSWPKREASKLSSSPKHDTVYDWSKLTDDTATSWPHPDGALLR